VLSAVTLIVGVIVALTFLFGFGNVFSLALRFGVPVWVAALVAPAVDLSIGRRGRRVRWADFLRGAVHGLAQDGSLATFDARHGPL